MKKTISLRSAHTIAAAFLFATCFSAALTTRAEEPAVVEPSHKKVNEANNPLTPKITFNLHNYAQQLYGVDDWANSLLARCVLPTKIGGVPNIFRATVPWVFMPGGHEAGLGDINITDFIPKKGHGFEYGFGPQLTMPTASRDETGTGKWQAGAAALFVRPRRWGILAALATWQTSFAGESDRATQNNLTFQPIMLLNLPHTWYVRSSAIWNFQLNDGHHFSIPVGIGLGKVFMLKSGVTLNAFVEPQWTLFRQGNDTPQFQVFVGLNAQFPMRRKSH